MSIDITNLENGVLTKEVANDEILEIIKQIDPMKVLWRDEIQTIFYRKCCENIGKFLSMSTYSCSKKEGLYKTICQSIESRTVANFIGQ